MKKTLTLLLTGLVIPGAGHVLAGRLRAGLGIQILLLTIVLATCTSRLILAPYALTCLVITIIALHCASGLLAARQAQSNTVSLRSISQMLLFSTLALTCATTLFLNKTTVLGINLYYIPSTSMLPTLAPGDIILVDTWVYRNEAPQPNDIATFHDPLLPARTLIKRVADIRGPSNEGEGLAIFFRGDNANHSSDSRHFGWVPVTEVTGRYVCTLPCMATD